MADGHGRRRRPASAEPAQRPPQPIERPLLGMPLPQQQRRTFQVLKWVGLQHRMSAYPQELSGGEQQRIAIARALVNDPFIILADEPTGNLDPDTSDVVFDALAALIREEGAAALIATHNHDLARRANRIVTLRGGLIEETTL